MRSPFLAGDDAAVSPVLGVVLMVSLTVVLAGTVHLYVQDFGEEQLHEPSPQSAFALETEECGLSITHIAGDEIPAEELVLRSPDTEVPLSGTWASPESYTTSTANEDDAHVGAGDRAIVCKKDSADVKDATIQLVWKPADDDRSVVLREWAGE